MHIKIVKIGSDRSDPLVGLAADYLKRMAHVWRVEVTSLKEIKQRNAGSKTIVKLEGEAIIRAVKGCDMVVALDANGAQMSSENFASQIDRWQIAHKSMAFIIGGASGLSQEALDACGFKLALSKMTLPHRLAYLTLVEQIYRASQILSNGPYHK